MTANKSARDCLTCRDAGEGCEQDAEACIAVMLVGDDGRVFGMDCALEMVTKAAKNAHASGFPQAVSREADMTELPLPDCLADAIISNGDDLRYFVGRTDD